MKDKEIDRFLGDVYSGSSIDVATNMIASRFDDLFENKNYESCNRILEKIDVEQLPIILLRYFLIVTNNVKTDLPCRSDFFRSAENKIRRVKGPNNARDLLIDLQ